MRATATPRRVWAVRVGGCLIAAASAAVVAALGPEAQVVCGRGYLLDRIAQAVMERLGAGHIDGPSASNCVVPTTVAWLMSLAALMAVLGVTLVLARRRASNAAPALAEQRG